MDRGELIAGRYRLREELGRGGMSVVWRADDDVLGREVAVKVLSAVLADDPDQRRLIRDEARAAARLRHANVVAVYDYGDFAHGGRTLSYVVMELADGRTLAQMLSGGRLPWKVATLVGAQVAAALAAAHADGIVHRDVKPANVMVTSGGVKLVDFGISAAVGAFDGGDGQLVGTPAYLAPERIKGGPVRPATDVYALGVLMYLALAGKMPWDASTVTGMVKAHVYAKPAPLPLIPGLPLVVTRLVSRCLAKRPADRPSAVEVADVLGEVAGLPSAALLRSVSAPTVTLPPVRTRRPGRAVLIAAGAVTGLLAAGGFWWTDDGPARPAQADAVTVPSTSATTPAQKPSTSRVTPRRTVRSVAVSQQRVRAVVQPAPKAKQAAKANQAAKAKQAAKPKQAAKHKPPKAPKPPKAGKPPKHPKKAGPEHRQP
ncbi:serine/threonine-protein kinase [Actinoplanes sp. Pm04-4]|uniref:non-specific serine/threonine protein kinase n=1 Tax=Paractinoplanes pyxinae TaxID=2997416 RepID=A0ABT4AQG2_9ACTN|nr:serine/threonine-protein kinase [Actinoplanes pyxinae]MCY1136476.1 serine/threonine-protein kinase [Actinoplanes pyxinae]